MSMCYVGAQLLMKGRETKSHSLCIVANMRLAAYIALYSVHAPSGVHLFPMVKKSGPTKATASPMVKKTAFVFIKKFALNRVHAPSGVQAGFPVQCSS